MVKNRWLKIGSSTSPGMLFTLVQYLIAANLPSQYPQINLASMCINIILAVSLSLINGFTGQLSLGHAGFMAVGAYVAVIMTICWIGHCVILAGCLAAALAGFIIGVPTLRLKGITWPLPTGFGEIIGNPAEY